MAKQPRRRPPFIVRFFLGLIKKIIIIRTEIGSQHGMHLAKKHITNLGPYKTVIADKYYLGGLKLDYGYQKRNSTVVH